MVARIIPLSSLPVEHRSELRKFEANILAMSDLTCQLTVKEVVPMGGQLWSVDFSKLVYIFHLLFVTFWTSTVAKFGMGVRMEVRF